MNLKRDLSELSLNDAFGVKEILGEATFNPLKCERREIRRRIRRKNKNNSQHKNKNEQKERGRGAAKEISIYQKETYKNF